MTATTIPQTAPGRPVLRIVWPKRRKVAKGLSGQLKAFREALARRAEKIRVWLSHRKPITKMFVMFSVIVLGSFAAMFVGYMIALPFALAIQALGFATVAAIAYELGGVIIGLTLAMTFLFWVEPFLDF